MTDRMTKQESSIPVQSRVSIISLAELATYWETTEYDIRSMSQLISWSLDLLRDILKANKMLEDSSESVIEARDYLVNRHLWQAKVAKRAFTKIGNAVRFQGFREEGVNPETRDEMSKIGHNLMHNKHSVSPYRDKVSTRKQMVAKMTEMYHKLEAMEGAEFEEPEMLSQEEARAKYFKEQTKLKVLKGETIEEVKHSNVTGESEPSVKEGMTDEEWEAKQSEIAKRDHERLELENAPFEVSDLPTVVVGESDK